MNSGRLRHRVSIQQRSGGQDSLGQPLDDWSEYAQVWAAIDDQRGRQIVESREATVNELTTALRIRYRADIVPEMRAVELCHAGRTFDIIDVQYTQPPRPEVMLECLERRVQVEAAS